MPQIDNSTLEKKAALRIQTLRRIESPCVMETHGGLGKVWQQCYSDMEPGVVFEKNPGKAAKLGQQRPTWAVYEADCVSAIKAGVGFHLPVNFFDIDPYGEPWPVIDAILSNRLPDRFAMVVNDGMRRRAKMNGAWDTHSMRDAVAHFGNGIIYSIYLDVCRWMLEKKVAQAGFGLSLWTGYYCGYSDQVTHYSGIFSRR